MDPGPELGTAQRVVGRYVLHGEIAHGGMATVHYGRLVGEVGFSRTVAIKCLHAQFAKDPDFKSMFLDEARLCARIRHPNVVPILDVVALEGELFMVMEYVQGETLSRLVRNSRNASKRVPLRIVSAILTNALEGLHAAHEAVSELGEPLGIVHRDVSPQNIMVGVDGVARVLDFGVAKAAGRLQSTRDGQLKGKLPYMAPEQLRGSRIDRRTDVYAAAVVLWESLTGRRLFDAEDEVVIFGKVLEGAVEPPSRLVPGLPRALDEVCLRGLAADPDRRFQSAQEMAIALEHAVGVAIPREVGRWVDQMAGASLKKRSDCIAEIESVPSGVSLSAHAVPNRPTPPPPSVVQAQPPGQPFAPPGVSAELASNISTVSALTSRSVVTAPSTHYDPGSAPSQISQAQMTVLAMSRAGEYPPQKKNAAVIVAVVIAGILVLAGLVAVIIVVSRVPHTPDATAASTQSASAATAPTAAPTASPPTTAIAIEQIPTAVMPTATAVPSVTATQRPPGTGKTAGGKTAATADAPPTATATATATVTATETAKPPPPKTDCNPPYTLDSNGVRIPKPQCL